LTATYSNGEQEYDVSKLSDEGQNCFSYLALAQQKVNQLTADLTIAQAASVALHQKMQELLTEEALISEDNMKED
jgi:hypothetical protein